MRPPIANANARVLLKDEYINPNYDANIAVVPGLLPTHDPRKNDRISRI
jgi:hypothetical protein